MNADASPALQYGVVPLRAEPDGWRILLITSRETRRWVVPRGNPIRSLSPAESAAQEAFEEAGVRGTVSAAPLGSYRYDKRRRSGAIVTTEVQLFRLAVTEELDDWPEKGQRERRWVTPDEAAALVTEPDLQALLRTLSDPLC
jgi:8-oxo-dGTP pyrophosphatase MutT (NUDIX family)